MPETLQPFGAVIPLLDEASPEGIPGQLKVLVRSLEDNLIGQATSTGDRDARFGTAGPGALVVSWQRQALWLKTGAATNAWVTLFEDTGWVSTEIAPEPGWALHNDSRWRIRNGVAYVELSGTRIADELLNSATASYYDNVPVLSLTNDRLRPGRNQNGIWAAAAFGGAQLWRSGAWVVTSIAGATRIAKDETISSTFSFPLEG